MYEMLLERVIQQVENVIIGKRHTIEQVLIAVLSGGHILLEDVPGVGKTMLVRAMAKSIDCTYQRIQFTPDLMPSDITGVNIYNHKTAQFEFRPGPIMSNIVLADEMNRTSPKTQAALLEAMEEHCVTVDGVTHELPKPFFLLATQNPLEHEGTYSLPEAQLDRFMLKIKLGYPEREAEMKLLTRVQLKHPIERVKPVLMREELLELQKAARKVHVDETLIQYIVLLSESTRKHPALRLGVSPRASIALMRCSQSLALLRGRNYIIPDDIKEMIRPVFAHRLVLNAEARMTGIRRSSVLQQIIENIPVPTLRYASGN